MPGLRIDLRHAPAIAVDFYLRVQAGELDLSIDLGERAARGEIAETGQCQAYNHKDADDD